MLSLLPSTSQKPALKLPTFDMNVLTPIYTTGARLGSDQHAAILKNGVLKDILNNKGIVPPWQVAQPQPSTDVNERLGELLRTKKLIDKNDPVYSREDLTSDYQNLFVLWKGLNKLNQLVDFATNESSADNMREILDRQFQTQLGEIKSFVDQTTFNNVSLINGLKTSTLESSVKRPDSSGDQYSVYGFKLIDSQTEYYGNTATTVRSDPIAGLTGNETFTITVTENGSSRDIPIDLSGMSGSPTIDNITDYINTQLAADGNVATTFEVKRENEYSYKMQINLSVGEEISFSAGAGTTEPAVYVAGTYGGADLSGGFLQKLDDLASSTPNESVRSDINTDVADNARGTAVDSDGNVYVVGTTSGNIDNQINNGTGDVYLNKYDAAGNVIWTRLLGASDSASGYSVAVDSSDNVVIAGQTSVPLTDVAYGGTGDTFVTKFDSTGQEQWTRQAAPYAADGANAVTIDSNDNIFIAGYVNGAIDSSATNNGGTDAFLTKLDSDGALQYNKQFGTSGNDAATDVVVDNAGNVFVTYNDGTNGYVRKYVDETADNPPTFETDLGAVGSDGAVTGLALDGSGNVYVSGYTSNSSLNGTVTQAHSGGVDGFVTKLDDSTGAISFVSYVGTSGDDKAMELAVNGTDVYVTGNTDGTLSGATAVGSQDGFVVKLDDTGSQQWAKQFGGAFDTTGYSIAFDNTGTSVLSRLGLPTGSAPGAAAATVVAQTGARAGQSFLINVDNESPQVVTLENDDTFTELTFKIRQALGGSGTATLEQDGTNEYLVIKATNGARVDIKHGPDGYDALNALGLTETTLYGTVTDTTSEDAAAQDQYNFALGIVDNLNLLDTKASGDAGDIISNAMRVVRDAFDIIQNGPQDDTSLPPTISAEDQDKINKLQGTLNFVKSLAAQPASTFSLNV